MTRPTLQSHANTNGPKAHTHAHTYARTHVRTHTHAHAHAHTPAHTHQKLFCSPGGKYNTESFSMPLTERNQ